MVAGLGQDVRTAAMLTEDVMEAERGSGPRDRNALVGARHIVRFNRLAWLATALNAVAAAGCLLLIRVAPSPAAVMVAGGSAAFFVLSGLGFGLMLRASRLASAARRHASDCDECGGNASSL